MSRTIIHSVALFDGISLHPSLVIFNSDSGLIEHVSNDSVDSLVLLGNETLIESLGCTLIPGLIDAHVHVHNLHLPVEKDNTNLLQMSLKYGITTGGWFRGQSNSVRLKSSLLGATIQGGWPKPIVLGHNPSSQLKEEVANWPSVTEEGVAAFISSHKTKGADYIKLMQEDCCSMSWETGSPPTASLKFQTALANVAHSVGLKAVAHALSLENTATVLKAGVDGLTHTFFDQRPTKEIVKLHKATGVFVIPTLSIISSLTDDEHHLRWTIATAAEEKGLCEEPVKSLMLQTVSASAPESRLEHAYETVRTLKRAGIDIVAGTDSVAGLRGMAMGPSLWMELELYVRRCGMTALEALCSATGTSARRFSFTDRGMVKAGKRADLVLIKGDPSQGLSCLWEDPGIIGVWKQGFRAA